MNLTVTAGRDYRTSSKYEYVIFHDEEVVAREGFFTTGAQAKRAGIRAARALIVAEEARCPTLPL